MSEKSMRLIVSRESGAELTIRVFLSGSSVGLKDVNLEVFKRRTLSLNAVVTAG